MSGSIAKSVTNTGGNRPTEKSLSTKEEQRMELLTTQQAAEFLGVSPRLVSTLLRRQEVPSLKIGGLRRFDKAALLEWLRRGGSLRQESGAPPAQ